MLLSCLFVALTSISITLLPAEDEPFLATAIGQNTTLRSGPGDEYYATNRVDVGQMLEVYYVIDDQWCAVRPPTGSFTWVDARNVRLDKNQVGVVLINGVNARVGSELSNSCGAVQVVLDRGEKVFVFERVETPNDNDTPVWYKIAPPAGEFRFIRLTELQFDHVPETVEQPQVLQTQSPIILVSGVQEQTSRPSTNPSRQGSSQLSSIVMPPNSLPIPGASRNSGNAATNQTTPNQDVRIAANTRPSDNPATTQNTQANTQANAMGNSGIDSNDFREIFEQLKLDLADALLEQETANETMQSLGHQARMLYQSATNQNERAEAYQLIAGIERATRVRRHETEQNHSDNTVTKTNSHNNTQSDERYDRRVVQLPDVPDTDESEASPPTPPLQLPSQKPAGTSPRLALPRHDMGNMSTLTPPEINTTPEPNYAAPIEQYSAQESFFDRSGRHVAAQSHPDQHIGQQDFEIYLANGRYVDASGQPLDSQTLSAILQGADVVLMYDPQTGGYQQMSQQQLQYGQYPGTSRQPNSPQKNWLQRLVSGELFQSEKTQGQQLNTQQQFGQVSMGSGYAPHTYQSTYGNNGYAPAQQSAKQGLFATSQQSLIPQQQNRNNAMPGMYPNNTPRGWQGQMQGLGQGQAMPPAMMQEITLPDGVQVPGEMVIYDESQGINLLGNAQNASQPDQLALLLQQMSTPTMTGNMAVTNSQTDYRTPQVNLPVTEAETRMRTVQLRSDRQEAAPNRNANHQVTGHLENGVGRVSSAAFDGIGKLGRVKNAGGDMPQFALVDASGKTICLVTPTPGVELGTYINKTIGITGILGNYVHEGETFRHISAKAVYPIAASSSQ